MFGSLGVTIKCVCYSSDDQRIIYTWRSTKSEPHGRDMLVSRFVFPQGQMTRSQSVENADKGPYAIC